YLDHEENPLGRPTEDEDMNQQRSGSRIDQSNDEPDTDPGDGTEHHGQQQKKPGVPFGEGKDVLTMFTQAFFLGVNQVQTTAHCKMRDKDMKNCDQRNEHSAANLGQIPDRIVHDNTP